MSAGGDLGAAGQAAPPLAGLRSVARRLRVTAGAGLLGVCAVASVELWCGASYLASLYGGLGRGVLPALFASWVLLASVFVSAGLWACWPLLAARRSRRPLRAGLLLGIAAAVALAAHSGSLARARALGASSDRDAWAAALGELTTLADVLPRARRALPPLAFDAAVECAAPPGAARVTLIASYIARSDLEPVTRCLQAPGLAEAVASLRGTLAEEAARGPVQLEVASGLQELPSRHAWLDGLKLRPGLDGVCHERRCALPWQLLALGAFSTHRPLQLIPDLQFGVDARSLRALVGAAGADGLSGLVRLETLSYVLDLAAQQPRLTALARLRRSHVAVGDRALERAERAAEEYVLAAQQPDGRFRYTLDPFTGQADTRGFNLARQAGTTLVLCELGRRTRRTRAAIVLALEAFRPFLRTSGELIALTSDARNPHARLGESALPLVSMLACAERTRSVAPEVAGLARLVLRLQRPDGGFAPAVDLRDGRVLPGPDPLYAPGQALLALVLLEHRLSWHESPSLPSLKEVHGAVERAMRYFARDYWAHPLRDFFFIEENWHCLAARAALAVHRDPEYEKLCLDYVRFKARLILSAEQGAPPEFDGGFGFGHLVPPHNTGAAGFGEALAAAIAVLDARGAPADAEKRLLGRVAAFLLRQQWTRDNCFACVAPEVVGGMSEHTHSSITRIDFAQHAWAALGHGRRALEGTLSP